MALFLLAGCATAPPCREQADGREVLIRATRGDGGVLGVNMSVAIDAVGHITYNYGGARCGQLSVEELDALHARLASPSFVAALQHARSNEYEAIYRNSPHIQIETTAGSSFVPMYLAIEEPLLPVLAAIDVTARRAIGRGYRLTLLPPATDWDYYRSLKQ